MAFTPMCATCGGQLPVPPELALDGERCVSCMIAAEEALHDPLDFDYWNGAPPQEVHEVKFFEHLHNGQVVRIDYTIDVDVTPECAYCGNRHLLPRTFKGTMERPPAWGDTDAGKRMFGREKAAEITGGISWKETEGVLCPKCHHFAPRAVARHFFKGYVPFLLVALEDSGRAFARHARMQCIILPTLGYIGLLGILFTALWLTAQSIPEWHLLDRVPGWGFGFAALVCSTPFLWIAAIRWRKTQCMREQRAQMRNIIHSLSRSGIYYLVSLLYEMSSESLFLTVDEARFQFAIAEAAKKHLSQQDV
jgi:hypothetical protein